MEITVREIMLQGLDISQCHKGQSLGLDVLQYFGYIELVTSGMPYISVNFQNDTHLNLMVKTFIF